MKGLKTATLTDKNFINGDGKINPAAITSLKEDIKALYDTIMNGVHPVGSLYVNFTDARNPAQILGFGTWAAVEGLALVGYKAGDADFGTIGTTVGEKKHTLTVAELPAHKPVLYGRNGAGSLTKTGLLTGGGDAINANAGLVNDISSTMDTVGSGTSHNNIQPSIIVYMWQRTA